MNGKVYIGTQGFHDVGKSNEGTTTWSGLCNYRGSYLIEIDVATGKLKDLSASKPDGVFQKCQGIIGLSAIPSLGLIVAGSHPRTDLIYYNPQSDKIERNIQGLGDALLAPPRSLVALANGNVFYSRGWDGTNSTYMYDYAHNTTVKISGTKGGFWNGRAQSCDGWNAWVASVDGNLYEVDTRNGRMNSKGVWPGNTQLLCMSMSRDEKKLYSIPSQGTNLQKLIEYDIMTGKYAVLSTQTAKGRHITGNNVRDSKGRIYFAASDYTNEGWIVEADVSDRTGPAASACNTVVSNSYLVSVQESI